jgi:hypothetical protein
MRISPFATETCVTDEHSDRIAFHDCRVLCILCNNVVRSSVVCHTSIGLVDRMASYFCQISRDLGKMISASLEEDFAQAFRVDCEIVTMRSFLVDSLVLHFSPLLLG